MPATGNSSPSQTGHQASITSGGSNTNSVVEDDLEVDGEGEEEGSAESSLPDTPPPSGRQTSGQVTLDPSQESKGAELRVRLLSYCVLILPTILAL